MASAQGRGSFRTPGDRKEPQLSDLPGQADLVVPFGRYGSTWNHDLHPSLGVLLDAPEGGCRCPSEECSAICNLGFAREARGIFSPQRSGGEVNSGEGYRHPPYAALSDEFDFGL